MAMFIPFLIWVLPLLLAEGAAMEKTTFCVGEDGRFVFATGPPPDANSLYVMDSTNNAILHWSKASGKCTPYDLYLRGLDNLDYCNKTHIVFTLRGMKEQDSGNITVTQEDKQTVLKYQSIIVTGPIFLNRSCTFDKQEQKLKCNGNEQLRGRTIMVQDSDGEVLHSIDSFNFNVFIPERKKSTFRVVLNANPNCFHPLIFTRESVPLPGTPKTTRPADFGDKSTAPTDPSSTLAPAGYVHWGNVLTACVVVLVLGPGILFMLVNCICYRHIKKVPLFDTIMDGLSWRVKIAIFVFPVSFFVLLHFHKPDNKRTPQATSDVPPNVGFEMERLTQKDPDNKRTPQAMSDVLPEDIDDNGPQSHDDKTPLSGTTEKPNIYSAARK